MKSDKKKILKLLNDKGNTVLFEIYSVGGYNGLYDGLDHSRIGDLITKPHAALEKYQSITGHSAHRALIRIIITDDMGIRIHSSGHTDAEIKDIFKKELM